MPESRRFGKIATEQRARGQTAAGSPYSVFLHNREQARPDGRAPNHHPETLLTIMPNATVFDVAERAGVSIKTVSRVVNSEPHVRPSTKERVDLAIVELDYRPDEAARKLASHRSQRGL